MKPSPTSIVLTVDLKAHIQAEAKRRALSMSDVIREKLLTYYQGVTLPHRRGAIRKGRGEG